MKTTIVLCILVAFGAVLADSKAQDTYMVASSCNINVNGCPNAIADKDCNKCCRSAGCDRGDCDAYNCKCTGCPKG